jgi:hypothetical protein
VAPGIALVAIPRVNKRLPLEKEGNQRQINTLQTHSKPEYRIGSQRKEDNPYKKKKKKKNKIYTRIKKKK